MITKIFKVKDYATLIHYLVVQFEENDHEICKEIGIIPGFKIVNRMSGRVVDTFSGYNFDPESDCYSLESQSRKFYSEGTSNAFGLLLNEIDNIKKLPNDIDVEQIRNMWVKSSLTQFIDEGIIETLEEYETNQIRKCLYSTPNNLHIALIDIIKKEVIYDIGSTYKLNFILPKYLWIPVQEADVEFLENIDINIMLKEIIKPHS